ncbi:LOW QUALITY PROTEIN: synaptonemal complex protein ZEP1-like [Acropora millepora]|uniref:LOW QUALITY PROTEIN: synaptonemal complex protein ZEP1-like n=1 Tax=Acropora millepora TaxID=45264 RepID=UPI001CF5F756|nr:LOW QUALITY PROTEIN: synaptonemal complex protein ZEP1-like [Acropora millepora]
MKRSKFKDSDTHKEPTSRQPDSDGSGSVVSLHSSSSSDEKVPENPQSESRTMTQIELAEEITALKSEGGRPKVSQSKLDKLQKKLQELPTQDTLDEIIHSVKNQNYHAKDLPNTSANNGKSFSFRGSVGWHNNAIQPQQMSVTEKCGDNPAKQLKDISAHFEVAINKMHDQLCSVGNSLLALHDGLPIKMLEAANHKLEARCNVLEQVCDQMKNKFSRLELSNDELDRHCGQLRQVNQNLEVRCLYLEQVSQSNENEKTDLQKQIHDLKDRVAELAGNYERATSAYHELENLNQKNEIKIQSVEEAKKHLESKYKSCASDNQKKESQIEQYQKCLDQYKKKCRECEEAIVASRREKENLVTKLELLNKEHAQIVVKYDELKSICAPKDELIARLDAEMKELSGFVEKTIKEKTEAESKSKRDEELLQRMLTEYDILARDYQQAQESRKAIHEKLESSQTEMTNLRETISKLASRNTILEEASKENGKLQANSVEQLPVKSKSSKGRKTWDQSTPVKKREPHLHNTSTSYKRSEMMRDVLGNESVSSSHPYTPMDTYSSLATPSSCVRKQDFISCETQSYASAPNGSSLGRKQDLLSNETQTFISASTSSSLGKKPDFSSSGPKTSTPIKKHPVKSVATKDSPELNQAALPGGMMVKKTNLLTMFDVVFEDTNSGEEMFRSHTGRTCRTYSEPAQTEATFLPSTDEAASGVTDSSFSTSRNTRMLTADDYEVFEPRKSRSNQRETSNIAEKDFSIPNQAVGRDNGEENTKICSMEKRFLNLTEERKRLESTLSRMTKRSDEDKAYLESRLEEVAKELAFVRSQLRRL